MTVLCGRVEPNQSAANAAVCDLPAGHGGCCEGFAQGPAAAERPGRHRWALLTASHDEHSHEWLLGDDTCAYEGCDASYAALHPTTFTCPLCGAESAHPDDVTNRYCGRCHKFTDDALRAVAEKLKDMTMELDGLLPGQGCVRLSAVMRNGGISNVVTVSHAALMSESRDGWDIEIVTVTA